MGWTSHYILGESYRLWNYNSFIYSIFKEPKYEYEFMPPYIQPWNRFEMRDRESVTKGFNEFLDEHRDPKDIEKEVLLVSVSLNKDGLKISIPKIRSIK